MHLHRTPLAGAIVLSPFEALLEELHAVTVAGDEARGAELRATIEADLGDRGRVFGIGGAL
jgi:hypothetical protein